MADRERGVDRLQKRRGTKAEGCLLVKKGKKIRQNLGLNISIK